MKYTLTLCFFSALLLPACSGDDTSLAAAPTGTADAGATSGADGAIGADSNATSSDTGGTTAVDAGSSKPAPPAPLKYSGGDCPKLITGTNTIFSWDKNRTLDLFKPTSGAAKPGLLFMWHGLGDNKGNFGTSVGAQYHADTLNVMVAVPQAAGSITGWGWTNDTTALADATFFDDMLTCIDKQFDIDNRRVFTTGFSAGALWSSYLVIKRSTYLAAAVIWSGGTGAKAYDYKHPKRKIPVLMSWGGAGDNAFIAFQETTTHMITNLVKDGHVVIGCNHKGGHTIPGGGLNYGLKFLAAHDWNSLTTSKFADGDLKDFPSYCELKSPKK